MNPIPGELYLVDLGAAGKVRPAVVVSRQDADSPRAVALCAPLTTQCRGSGYEVALGKLRILNQDSWVNVQGLMAVGHERMIRKLGRISAAQLDQVKAALRYALDLG